MSGSRGRGQALRGTTPRGLPAHPRTVTTSRWPDGAGLRVDRAIESGSTVSASYDSLVAKVMAHGRDRAQAVARLSLALRTLELDGLETNRDMLGAVLDDGAYRDGAVDVHYLERRTRSP